MRLSTSLSLPAALTASSLLGVLVSTGCSAGPSREHAGGTPHAGPHAEPQLAGLVGERSLATLRGVPLHSLRPVDTRLPTLKIESDGRVSGSSGINRYASSLDLDALSNGRFMLSPTIGTKMGGSPEAMSFETTFLAALNDVTTFDLDGDALVLGKDGTEVMRFVRSAP